MGLKVKRRKKSGRFRGSHSHGRGFKKKARGSGHRGGFGMSGTGKRADHRKSYVLAVFGPDYFGKRQTKQSYGNIKLDAINIQKLAEGISGFVRRGIAKENKGIYEVDLKNFKIVGSLESKVKMRIHAGAASQGAIDSVKKQGGDVVLEVVEKVEDVKKEDSKKN